MSTLKGWISTPFIASVYLPCFSTTSEFDLLSRVIIDHCCASQSLTRRSTLFGDVDFPSTMLRGKTFSNSTITFKLLNLEDKVPRGRRHC